MAVTTTITVDEVLAGTAGLFRHRNGRNTATGTIHAVRIRDNWLGIAPLPVPGCGAGVGGSTGRLLTPTVDAVTCQLCQRVTSARAAAALVPTPHQYSLSLDMTA